MLLRTLEGQIYYGDYAKPEKFFFKPWEAIYQYVFALFHVAGIFYYKD